MTRKKNKTTRKKYQLKKDIKTKNTRTLFVLKENYAIGILFFFSILLYLLIFDSKIDLNGDNAAYYVLAKSLNNFQGYVLGNSIDLAPHGHYPPGYPFIIAPFMWISTSIIFIKILNGILYLITTIFFFKIIQLLRPNSNLENLIIAMIVASNYFLLKYSTIMMSELPLVASLILIIYFIVSKKYVENQWKLDKTILILGFLAALAFYIKSLAIPIILATTVHFIFKKAPKKAILVAIVFTILLIPWQIRNNIHGIKSSYLNQLTKVNPYRPELGTMTLDGFINRFASNFDRYLSKEIPAALFPLSEYGPSQDVPSEYYIFGILAVLSVFIGFLKLKELRHFFFVYIGTTFGILLLWPEVWFGVRFMLSLIPVLLLLFLIGLIDILNAIGTKFNLRMKRIKLALLFLILFWVSGFLHPAPLEQNTLFKLNKYRNQPYPLAYKNYFEVAKWTNKNIDSETVIACRKTTMFHLFSKGKAERYPYTENENEFFSKLQNKKAKYIVLDQLGYSSTQRYVVPRVNSTPEKFKVIYKTNAPETYLLEIVY